eukprot:Rmarinus@m.1187
MQSLFESLRRDKGRVEDEKCYDSIIDGLKKIYTSSVRPIEDHYLFNSFYNYPLSDADFEAKPFILLLGQYSTGKTTFVNYLLGQGFPGQHIGPEPTTDGFFAVMKGREEMLTPGHAAASQHDKPFSALSRFGMTFLNRFQVAQLNSPVLDYVSFIDTPGVLSGEKQRLDRGYDFTSVVKWFAMKADMILLLFDGSKLDISDEYKRTMEVVAPHHDKIRVVLNKADQVNRQELMRVYGALMWSLGKVFHTPEVVRVYIGSFIDQELRYKDNEELFQHEIRDLLKDLFDLQRTAAVRKVNQFLRRVNQVRLHMHVLEHLRKQMPSFMGRAAAQKKLIGDLENNLTKLAHTLQVPRQDLPSAAFLQERIEVHFSGNKDLSYAPKMSKTKLDSLERIIQNDIPRLLERFPSPADHSMMPSPTPVTATNLATVSQYMNNGSPSSVDSTSPTNPNPSAHVGGSSHPPLLPSAHPVAQPPAAVQHIMEAQQQAQRAHLMAMQAKSQMDAAHSGSTASTPQQTTPQQTTPDSAQMQQQQAAPPMPPRGTTPSTHTPPQLAPPPQVDGGFGEGLQ